MDPDYAETIVLPSDEHFPDGIRLLRARASAAKLRAPAPTEEDLEVIFECAVNAPDHGRLRPWHFITIRGDGIAAFGDVLAEVFAAENPGATPDRMAKAKSKAFRAPLIVVAVARAAPDAKVPEIEQILAVGAAVENMLLAAQALGYGTMWKTGAPAYSTLVKNRLGLESTDSIVGFIYLGTVDTLSKISRNTAETKVTRWPL